MCQFILTSCCQQSVSASQSSIISGYVTLSFGRFQSLSRCVLDHFQDEPQLAKITRDSAKITVEQVHGLMSQVSKYILTYLILFILCGSWIHKIRSTLSSINMQVIKDILFNSARQSNKPPSDPSDPEPMITS